MTTSRTYDGFNRLTGIASAPLLVAAAPIGARNSSSALESAPTVENPFQSPNVLPAACPSRADVAVRAPITDAGGSHNVVAYVSAATGAIVAEYEYGPFGELLRATGPLAKDFTFLFSTKYYDWETGLYYYGYRYYNPTTGRWLSRDPIGENGGVNVYGFASNDGVNIVDFQGLYGQDVHEGRTVQWAKQVGYKDASALKIGEWDNNVDKDFDPVWNFRDEIWSWHFDRSNGGTDSRLQHMQDELNAAKKYCTWDSRVTSNENVDDWEKAAKHLGRALHPLQDWVAHGDLNRRKESPFAVGAPWTTEWYDYAHNTLTTQVGRDRKSPDDATLDSTGSNGRSTFNVMTFATITSRGDRLYWATFNPGTQRIQLAEKKTKEVLLDFLIHVRKNSKDCGKCRQAFLRYFDNP